MSTGKLFWTFRCSQVSIVRVKESTKLELSGTIPFGP